MINDVQHISDLIAWLPTPMIESAPYSDFLISMQGQTMRQCINILKDERNKDYLIYKSREDEIDNYIYCEKEQTGIEPFLFFEIIDLIIDFCQLNEWNELNDTVDFLKFLHKNRYFNYKTFVTIQDDSKMIIFANWIALNEKIRFGGVRACYPTDNEDEYQKMKNDDANLIRAITFCNCTLDDYKNKREQIQIQQQETKTELSLPQIALIYIYNDEQITRHNGDEIAAKYGYKSGEALYQDFTKYSSKNNRIASDTAKRDKNKINLLKSVVNLVDTTKKQQVIDEIETLKSNMEKKDLDTILIAISFLLDKENYLEAIRVIDSWDNRRAKNRAKAKYKKIFENAKNIVPIELLPNI